MATSQRQQDMLQNNAANGWFEDVVSEPERRTMRQMSMETNRQGTVRQTVGSGARALWREDNSYVVDEDSAMETVQNHMEASRRTPSHTTYAAAQFDAQSRPTDTLCMPNQGFGSHLRPPTESHDASAYPGDHRGHGVAQASTSFAPGIHRSFMTSQSPEMNTAVQLPWERLVDQLQRSGRIVFWEKHNEFVGNTPTGLLPRATRERFIITSVNARGEDFQVHVNALVSQR